MAKPIRLEVIDNDNQHFAVFFDRPGRIEVSVFMGRVVAYVYGGTEPDQNDEPAFMYDGTIANEMASVGLR